MRNMNLKRCRKSWDRIIKRHFGYWKITEDITKAFDRVKKLGARKAIVISDMDFYKKLGFVNYALFSFYWKTE